MHQQAAKNQTATEAFVQIEYPNENFISDTAQYQSINEYTKTIIIPENVKIAESRIPINANTRDILIKELKQAEILAKIGNSVYFIPEHPKYKERLKDAVVNGALYEFRTISGNAETLEWHFKFIKKKKGIDTNIFFNITGNISKNDAIKRFGKILRKHPEYSGKIIMSFEGGVITNFLNSNDLR